MAVQKNASKTPGKSGEKSSGKSFASKASPKAEKSSSKFDSFKNLLFGGVAQVSQATQGTATGSGKKAGLSGKSERKAEKKPAEKKSLDKKSADKKSVESKTEKKLENDISKKTEKKGDSEGQLNGESSGRISAGPKSAGKGKQADTAKKNVKGLTPALPKVSASGKSASGKGKSNTVPAMQLSKGTSSSMLSSLKKSSSLLGAGRSALEAVESVCREVACEGLATTGGYCRLHYIKNWKKIKRKEVILREKKLNQYIEELVAKYPDKYIEAIQQDLASDKDFAKVIYDLDLDEGADDFDMEGGESVDSLIDSIKRDFDDDADAF